VPDQPAADAPDVAVAEVATVVAPADRAAVLALAAAAADADGVSPLDDQVRLDLTHGASQARHLFARVGDELAGYAHLHVEGSAGTGHLVVMPESRRRGVGTALLDAMTSAVTPLRLWSHGDLAEAQAFAATRGLRRVRDLWQMAGPLRGMPQPSYPDDIVVRTFEPGRDEAAWVAANAAAFAPHPEQGGMTEDDLRKRMAEPWFDPAGFFLAERAGELIGYHWTKVHPTLPGHDGPVGEVYVLGIVPSAQGIGLGTALTATGLRHLEDGGLDTVMLYVEGDNAAAIRVYEKLGLRRSAVDVMYEQPDP
jgi:mycothiol synthase